MPHSLNYRELICLCASLPLPEQGCLTSMHISHTATPFLLCSGKVEPNYLAKLLFPYSASPPLPSPVKFFFIIIYLPLLPCGLPGSSLCSLYPIQFLLFFSVKKRSILFLKEFSLSTKVILCF